MGRILNFVCVRDWFQVAVQQPLPELVAKLGAAVQPRGHAHLRSGGAYEGEVNVSGCAIRRIATHPKDSQAAVVVRGWFRTEEDHTAVRMVVRHGLHMVAFGWLLLLIAVAAAASETAGTADRTTRTSVCGGLALMASLWHWRLFRDVRRVKDEVQSLLEA